MSEPVLFDDPAVQVTASAVHVRRGGSYFLSQISSVHIHREASVMLVLLAIFLGFAGLAFVGFTLFGLLGSALVATGDGVAGAMNGLSSLFFCGLPGLLSFVGGVFAWRAAKPLFWLMLVTSAGQVRAISSYDFDQLERLRVAIIGAMSQRR